MISSVGRTALDLLFPPVIGLPGGSWEGRRIFQKLDETEDVVMMSTSELKVALAEAFAAGQEHANPSPWSWGRIGHKQRPTTLSFEKFIDYEIRTASGDVVRRTYVEES